MSDYFNNQNNQNEQNQNLNANQNQTGYSAGGAQPNEQPAVQPAQPGQSVQPGQSSWGNTASWSNNGYSTGGQTGQSNQTYTPYGTGYVPYTPPTPQPKKPKKEKKGGISTALVACLLCACLVIGAGAGIGGALLVTGMNDPAEKQTVNVGNNADSGSQNSGGDTATFYQSSGTQVIVQNTGVGSASGSKMTVAEVIAAVKDSVVEITTETVVRGSRFSQYVTSGAGSGVIIAKEGYVITNNHVIDGADTVVVRTTDGTEYAAEVVGADATSDIAVLKIDPAGASLTVAVLGDSSKLVVGEEAIAIGNPLGSLGGTVTNGIISALDREISIDGQAMHLLQTNAAVNPGNSGGGLFNLAGELIGIVNAKSSGDDVEGLGFAIPINTAQEIAAQLIEFGYVRGRVELGLKLIDISSIFDLMAYNLSTPGVYVYESPYTNEIQSGDRIQAINGTAVSSTADIKAAYSDLSVGDVVTISLVRGNRVIEVNLTLREVVPTSTGVEFGE